MKFLSLGALYYDVLFEESDCVYCYVPNLFVFTAMSPIFAVAEEESETMATDDVDTA